MTSVQDDAGLSAKHDIEGTCYDQIYIGKAMLSVRTQQDLTTNPEGCLAHSTDPILLVHAVVDKLLLNFQSTVKRCIQEADLLLNSTCAQAERIMPLSVSLADSRMLISTSTDVHGHTWIAMRMHGLL